MHAFTKSFSQEARASMSWAEVLYLNLGVAPPSTFIICILFFKVATVHRHAKVHREKGKCAFVGSPQAALLLYISNLIADRKETILDYLYILNKHFLVRSDEAPPEVCGRLHYTDPRRRIVFVHLRKTV